MGRAEPCNGCSQAHNCARVYQQLGRADGPFVVWKAIIAFVLPIVAFIAALATFDHLLDRAVAERYRALPVFVMALTVTIGLTLATSFLLRRRHEER
jgi:Na+-transporting NADH:ubiquinone oxidoreductase subunit NqrE